MLCFHRKGDIKRMRPEEGSVALKRATVPLAFLFAIGCLCVILAFTAVTVFSGISFTATVDDLVTDNLNLALLGAMQQIMIPLQESDRYLGQLREKIQNEPDIYAIDDSKPDMSISKIGTFFADATFAGLQRSELTAVYQVRQSSKYEHAPGFPVDSLALLNFFPGNVSEMLIFTNNTIESLRLINNVSKFRNLSAEAIDVFPYNTSGEDYLTQTYATVGRKWDIQTYTIPGDTVTTTLMTLYMQIYGFPDGRPFGIGIDHNMVSFREYMLQASVPFSTGTTNPAKVVWDGAHTSLYDLSKFALMTTSVLMNLYQPDRSLWPAGKSPSSDVNEAYFQAMSFCETASCGSIPKSKQIGSILISVVRHQESDIKLDMMLVSVVPRRYFYSTPDTTLHTSIGVAVGCCVLLVGGCVAILFAIRGPLHKLEANMLLAADLKNDWVECTLSRLTEIAKLSSVFNEMNQRLLVARSYVPEAVLMGHIDSNESDDETDADFDEDDEGDDGRSSKNARRKSSSNNELRPSMYRSRRTDDDDDALSVASRTSAVETTLTTSQKMDSSTKKGTADHALSTLQRLKTTPTSLNERRVGVLAINMVGFSYLVKSACGGGREAAGVNGKPQAIQNVASRLLQIVVNAAQKERGVMDSFHGDHFTITFNASRAVAGVLAAAVRTANAIEEDAARDSELMSYSSNQPIVVACGASVGKAFIGTLGIEGYRRLSVVGPVYRAAASLQHTATKHARRTHLATDPITTVSMGGSDLMSDSSLIPPTPTMLGCFVDQGAVKELGSSALYLQLVGKVYEAHLSTRRRRSVLRNSQFANQAQNEKSSSLVDNEVDLSGNISSPHFPYRLVYAAIEATRCGTLQREGAIRKKSVVMLMGTPSQGKRPAPATHHSPQNQTSFLPPAGDEWLYELDAVQAGDPFVGCNDAVRALLDGKVSRCVELLTKAHAKLVPPPHEHQSPSLPRSSVALGLSTREEIEDSVCSRTTSGQGNCFAVVTAKSSFTPVDDSDWIITSSPRLDVMADDIEMPVATKTVAPSLSTLLKDFLSIHGGWALAAAYAQEAVCRLQNVAARATTTTAADFEPLPRWVFEAI